jgi:hypothetical protein
MRIPLTWQGGEHEFALPIGQLRALQDRCDAGPAHVLGRLASGQWRVDDVTETIRLALMGGGLERSEAVRLVKLHVEEKPLAQSVTLASAVLMAALYGPEDDSLGETTAGAAQSPSRADDGSSQASTAPEPH